MEKLWAGRLHQELDQAVEDFNASISFDQRLVMEDIAGSLAHAAMLTRQHIISADEGRAITTGLAGIAEDLHSGALVIDPQAEDIHTFVEAVLTERVGEAGKRLHTARSRNDQTALDLRLHLRKAAGETTRMLLDLVDALAEQAEKEADTIAPGYTHLQRAQPISFGHQLLAYAWMFQRDLTRLADWQARADVCPLGSGALAGVPYAIDRVFTAAQLGFSQPCPNSLDGVSDRDFVLELAALNALIMVHLSRLAEEIILWSSWEFHFIRLDDAYSTGSSIMPQKKNPDIAELIRGKSGRAIGDMTALYTLLKGLPLAYNKDMQEDKPAIFDSVDTVQACLTMCAPMIATMQVDRAAMRQAAGRGFINATDCADYLVGKGLPFRTAYQITGDLVADCISAGLTLEQVPLARYQQASPLFAQDIYSAIDLEACMAKRISYGGCAPQSVREQLEELKPATEPFRS